MENEKPKLQLGEMISMFPAEELKRAMLHLDRFDTEVVTDIEAKLDMVMSYKIISERSIGNYDYELVLK
jgi:hypothetical protein